MKRISKLRIAAKNLASTHHGPDAILTARGWRPLHAKAELRRARPWRDSRADILARSRRCRKVCSEPRSQRLEQVRFLVRGDAALTCIILRAQRRWELAELLD